MKNIKKSWMLLNHLPGYGITHACCDGCKKSNTYEVWIGIKSKHMYFKCKECNEVVRFTRALEKLEQNE